MIQATVRFENLSAKTLSKPPEIAYTAVMKRILIVTYYWPPATGAGVQRLLAFCRYLPASGFKITVISPSPDTVEATGAPINHISVPALDPAAWMKKSRPGAEEATARTAGRWMEYIRLNFLIPDSKIAWRRAVRRPAAVFMESEQPDVVLTSAPPYTAHLIGLDLKKSYGIPWIADFRDPWVENHAYNTVKRNRWAIRANRRMEAEVINTADHITCALESQRRLLSGKTERSESCFSLLRNGYDPADFPPGTPLKKTDRFFLSHFGTVYDSGLDKPFFRRLAQLVAKYPKLKQFFTLLMIGPMSRSAQKYLRSLFASGNLNLQGTIPHQEIIERLRNRQLLLLLVNRGTAHRYSHPSKAYEYLASGNPVLAVGPADHEIMSVLGETLQDRVMFAEAGGGWESFVLQQFENWQKDALPRRVDPPPAFDRQSLTAKLARICDNLIEA